MKESSYFEQTKLMTRVLPVVARETKFALKGGTAINFFIQNLPRLSVDIDLTYMPLEEREISLENISLSMRRIGAEMKKALPMAQVIEHRSGASPLLNKLTVVQNKLRVKIEPNTVLRGSVYPPKEMTLVSKAQKLFGIELSMKVLSIADIYGGKICAALDRQHPRDFFDCKAILDGEGLTPEIQKAFIVYLVSAVRPIAELLDPKPIEEGKMKVIFNDDFKGMALDGIEFEELIALQKKLFSKIHSILTAKERAFILSFKQGAPEWDLLGLEGIDQLPGVQWKLENIRKMRKEKHSQAIFKLKKILDL